MEDEFSDWRSVSSTQGAASSKRPKKRALDRNVDTTFRSDSSVTSSTALNGHVSFPAQSSNGDDDIGDFISAEGGADSQSTLAEHSYDAASNEYTWNFLQDNREILSITEPQLNQVGKIIFNVPDVKDVNQMKDWITHYEKLSGTQWLVENPRHPYHKYACGYSCVNKNRNGPVKNPMRSRNRNCPARMCFRFCRRQPDRGVFVSLAGDHADHWTFHDYGLRRNSSETVSKVMQLCQEKLDPRAIRSCLVDEFHLAGNPAAVCDSSVVPTMRQIRHLSDKFKRDSFGGSSFPEVYAKFVQCKAELEAEGVAVHLSESPFAVTLFTGVMQRSQQLPEANETLFIDSTSCVDRLGVSLTPYLIKSATGALPIGISLTEQNSGLSYTTAMQHLLDFNPNLSPKCIIRDADAALGVACSAVFPDSRQYICSFHCLQAHWRHLYQHVTDKAERKEIFLLIRELVTATTPERAEQAFQKGRDSPLVVKHGMVDRLSKIWRDRELVVWCYRSHEVHGSMTNNFSESVMKIVKDTVLDRTKQWNPYALACYLVQDLEKYYINRLLQYSYSQDMSVFRRLNKLCGAAHSFNNVVLQDQNGLVNVPSARDAAVTYVVNVANGTCNCAMGMFGSLCKHVLACALQGMQVGGNGMDLRTYITPQSRQLYSQIATGAHEPLSKFNVSGAKVFKMVEQRPSAGTDFLPPDFQTEPAGDDTHQELLRQQQSTKQEAAAAKQRLVDAFRVRLDSLDDNTLIKLDKKLPTITASRMADKLLKSDRLSGTGAKIPVQPTAISRRKFISSGSRSAATPGRPSKLAAKLKQQSRPHSLLANVMNNQPSAKKH